MSLEKEQINSLFEFITIPFIQIKDFNSEILEKIKTEFNDTPLWVRTINNSFCGIVNDLNDLSFIVNKAIMKSSPHKPIIVQKAVNGKTFCALLRTHRKWCECFEIYGVNFLKGMYRVPIEYWVPPHLSSHDILNLRKILHNVCSKIIHPLKWLQVELIKSRNKWNISFLCSYRNIDKSLFELEKIRKERGNNQETYFLRWIIPPSGVVEKITGISSAQNVQGVAKINIKLKPGELIRHISDTISRNRVGYIIATGKSLHSAIISSTKAIQTLNILTNNLYL